MWDFSDTSPVSQMYLYLFPRFNHAGSVGQDVDVFVFMVLVDL